MMSLSREEERGKRWSRRRQPRRDGGNGVLVYYQLPVRFKLVQLQIIWR
ncbi:hypothetical protein Hdeb2414_s0020g00560841 [Helianthus debilis subsp. tardiflorus]